MKDRFPRLTQAVLDGVKMGLFEDDVSQALLRNWQLGVCDNRQADMILRRVDRERLRQAFSLSPFRTPELKRGDLIPGKDAEGSWIRIYLQWLNGGLLIAGNTGATKTNLIKWLILQIAHQVQGLWVSDMYKQELRHLKPLLARRGIRLIVIRPRDVKINLLQADGIDPRTHISMAVDILGRVLDLPPRAMSILRAICDQLYQEFGIYAGKTSCWPTLFDVYERVRRVAGLNAPAREAILDRLGSLLTALTPGSAAYRLAWRPSDLTRHYIVYEMRGAGQNVKSILLNYLLFSVLYHRCEQNLVNVPMNLWCAFEDSQRFFSANTGTSGDMMPADEVAGLIRGSGTGLCVTAQTMVGLSKGLLPNLATKFMGRMGSHSDYQQLGSDLGMTNEQIAWAEVNLRPGTFICQTAEGPWRLPFFLRVPELAVPATVDDAEVAESLTTLDCLPTVPAREFADWQPRHMIEIASGPTEPTSDSRWSEAELRFLRAVVDHPGQPSSTYAKLAGIGSRQAVGIRRRLAAAGYLREHIVATGQRGRSAILLEPSQEAARLVNPALDAEGNT